ncbi:MAG: hypothetical protein ACREQA_12845 [Candidatus Binatia bacterium]
MPPTRQEENCKSQRSKRALSTDKDSSGLKFELDALANKDFQYLTKSYLPRKLKEKDCLD